MNSQQTLKLPVFETYNDKKSCVVLSWPHNGYAVPENLYIDKKPLGLEPYWFDPKHPQRRHEACDWGMKELFQSMLNKCNDYCFIDTNYSRLVTDLNRIETLSISKTSSEHEDQIIPLNQNLNIEQTEERNHLYHRTYHTELSRILAETKEHLEKVIWLDMHSFTPVWKGEKREVGVGTLVMERNNHTKRIENLFSDHFGEIFAADQPYDLSIEPFRSINAGGAVANQLDIDYFGVEIRSDLLEKPEEVDAISEKVISIIQKLEQEF